MPQGYDGLPNFYTQSSNPITPNLGLSLKGMDPIVAEDFYLIDTAFGTVSGSVRVNGSVVTNPNFIDSGTVTFSVVGSNISLTAAGGGGGTPGAPDGSIQGNNAGAFAGLPGSVLDFTNGLMSLTPTGTGVALKVTGDATGSNVQNWYINGQSGNFWGASLQTYGETLGLALFFQDSLNNQSQVQADQFQLNSSGINITLKPGSSSIDSLVIGPALSQTMVGLNIGGDAFASNILQAYTHAGAFGFIIDGNGGTNILLALLDGTSSPGTLGQVLTSTVTGVAWASVVAPANTPAVLHQWLKSYNSTTGAFTQTQPALSDISGTGALVSESGGLASSVAYYSSTNVITADGDFNYGVFTNKTLTLGGATKGGQINLYQTGGGTAFGSLTFTSASGLSAGFNFPDTNGSNEQVTVQPVGSDMFRYYVPNPTTTLGDTVYCSSTVTPGTIARLAGNTTTTKKFLTQTGNGTISAAPVWNVITAGDLPAGTGTVTSFSAGNLSPLFTTSVATATTTPALTFSLSNAGGGTVFGNNTSSAGAPAYTTTPVLGIPGTSTGSLAIASSTASGVYTITAPANAATPTLTLPTTSNVLAGQFAGDGTIFNTTLNVASAAGTLTATLLTQAKNTFLAGPASGANAAPTFRAIGAGDIPTGTVTWDQIGNAAANLTLSNAGFTTEFDQTSAVAWLWKNTTTATSGTTNASPLLEVAANYWTGAASAVDTWTIGSSLAAGTNGISTLTINHSGSTGNMVIALPTANGSVTTIKSGGVNVLAINGNTSTTLSSSSAVSTSRLVLQSNNNANNGAVSGIALNSGGNYAIGSGQGLHVSIFSTFSPSSGNASFTECSIAPTINQTGGANGAYTALKIAVTETAVGASATANKMIDCFGGASGTTEVFAVDSTGKVTEYAGTATVSQGMPSEIVTVDLTAQSAAIAATNIIASAPATGMYRISWSADITTAGTTSILGGAAGFQIGYTSPTDSVAKLTVSGNSTTSAANTTGTAVGGNLVIYAKTGTAITYQYDYTSTGTAMVYELHIKLERM